MRSAGMFVKVLSYLGAVLMLVASPVALHANSNSQVYPPNNSYYAPRHDKNIDALLSTYQKNHPGAINSNTTKSMLKMGSSCDKDNFYSKQVLLQNHTQSSHLALPNHWLIDLTQCNMNPAS